MRFRLCGHLGNMIESLFFDFFFNIFWQFFEKKYQQVLIVYQLSKFIFRTLDSVFSFGNK